MTATMLTQVRRELDRSERFVTIGAAVTLGLALLLWLAKADTFRDAINLLSDIYVTAVAFRGFLSWHRLRKIVTPKPIATEEP